MRLVAVIVLAFSLSLLHVANANRDEVFSRLFDGADWYVSRTSILRSIMQPEVASFSSLTTPTMPASCSISVRSETAASCACS